MSNVQIHICHRGRRRRNPMWRFLKITLCVCGSTLDSMLGRRAKVQRSLQSACASYATYGRRAKVQRCMICIAN